MKLKLLGYKFFSLVLVSLLSPLGASDGFAQDPQPLPVSKGVYRLPYADNTTVEFSNDHTNHPSRLNRYDMTGQGGGPYTVVAAAAGTIQVIVDNNNTFCPRPPATLNQFDFNGNGRVSSSELVAAVGQNPQNLQQFIIPAAISVCIGHPGPSVCCMRGVESLVPCSAVGSPPQATCTAGADGDGPNNYIWIEHENGEWTKYTHLQSGSVGPGPDSNGDPGAGHVVGDPINAGAPLGIEGDVGIATGPHLHFEVAADGTIEVAADGITPTGINSDGSLFGDGVLDDVDGDGSDDVNRKNRIPRFCRDGFVNAGGMATAEPCDDQCTIDTWQLSGTITPSNSPFYLQVTDTMGNPNSDFVAQVNSGVSIRAGERITLSPGFHAEENSFFSASIGACDTPGGIGE